MKNNVELVVPYNKNLIRSGPFSALFIILMCIINYYSITYLNHQLLNDFISASIISLIKGILIAFCIFIVGAFVYCFFLMKGDTSAAILSEDGIWVRFYGFIPWHNVAEVALYKNPGVPIHSIGIRVKDMAALSKQSSFNGKSGVFWSKIIGYPPIILSNIAIENEQVISFAHQFLKN